MLAYMCGQFKPSRSPEQPAGQRDISPVSVNLPSAFKTFLFQASFPGIITDPR